MLAPVADEQHVRLLQRRTAVGALGGAIRPGRLDRLARIPVRPLHRPRHHVLQPAEHRAAVAGVLGRPEAVRGIDGAPHHVHLSGVSGPSWDVDSPR